jgi:hypothetical protein
MPSLTTTIIIDASPDEVWLVLVNFPAWEMWNPFIHDIEGFALAGEKVKITISPDYAALNKRMDQNDPGNLMADAIVFNKSSNFQPRITSYQAGKLLAWKHKNWLSSYAQRFVLTPTEDGSTRFTNIVTMNGLLVNMGWEMAVKPMYQGGMELMNEALKAQVESGEWHSVG